MNPYMFSAFRDELVKISENVTRLGAAGELLGLGAIAAPVVDNMVARHRARAHGEADREGHVSDKAMSKYKLIGHGMGDAMDVGGLGVLAAPYIKPLFHGKLAMLRVEQLGAFSDELRKLL